MYLERNSFILWRYWVRISDKRPALLNEVSVDFISPYIKSKLSTSSKLLIYKTILKPIWTYGIQLWGTVPLATLKSENASNRKPCA
jgi:hypothetical protein